MLELHLARATKQSSEIRCKKNGSMNANVKVQYQYMYSIKYQGFLFSSSLRCKVSFAVQFHILTLCHIPDTTPGTAEMMPHKFY